VLVAEAHGRSPTEEITLSDDQSKRLEKALKKDPSRFTSVFAPGEDALEMLEPFANWWADAREAGYYLYGQSMLSEPAAAVRLRQGLTGEVQDEVINLSSYNYLGLSHRTEVREAAIEAIKQYGLGAVGAPVASGTFDVHEKLAKGLAEFKQAEAALLFSSGYAANVGVISALMGPGDLIIADQLAHASIVDGMVLSQAEQQFFKHNDLEDLEERLKKTTGRRLVVIEGIYSMDGDIAPLPEILALCRKYGARLMVDEAHSEFLMGENGRGASEYFGLLGEIDVNFGTLSKAIGGVGGFVVGSQALIDYLRTYSRSRTFSANIPPVMAAGMCASLAIVVGEPQLREKLWRNVEVFGTALRGAGIDIGASASPIFPIMIRNDAQVFRIAELLQERGVYVVPIRYPAVERGQSRLRAMITSEHTEEQLNRAASTIHQVLGEVGLPLN
jgi:glycine C-acetyltransferase